MFTLIDMLRRYWERTLLGVALILCMALCLPAILSVAEDVASDKSPVELAPPPRFFSWSRQPAALYSGGIPKAEEANPFGKALKSLQAPEPAEKSEEKKEEPAEKPEEKKEEPPAEKPEEKEEPPAEKPEEKKEEPPAEKPEEKVETRKVTVFFRGFYIDLSGDYLGLLRITEGDKTVTSRIRKGEVFAGGLTLKELSAESISVEASGQPKAVLIPWNEERTFELEKKP